MGRVVEGGGCVDRGGEGSEEGLVCAWDGRKMYIGE